MSDRSLLGLGVGGAIIATLCCLMPVLVVLLGVDVVLIPALIFFVALTIYALWRRRARINSGGER